MADEPDNVVLVMLRRIDAKLDRISDDMRDLKVRATATEEAIAGVNRRLDRLEMRVERIEKRLDLVEARPLLMRPPPERWRNFRRKAKP